MSALFGVVGLDGRPWSERELAPVAAALAPHGPDGGGDWSGTVGRCGVALGARLWHATPEDLADAQPARGAGGDHVLAFDGRLDNRDELGAALGLASEPDSAFVLAAYERWGEEAIERLVGPFALALADRRRGGILLARDGTGERPLVVHERPGVVAFASHALALTGLEGVGRTLDERRAAEVLALDYASPRTMVAGVRWFPPGELAWVDERGLRARPWWRIELVEPDERLAPEAHAEALREALERAVAACSHSLRPVGALTSGGLDSTSVTATAARRRTPAALLTFTAVPPAGWSGAERANWDADEAALVRELADMHQNVRPTFLALEPGVSAFAADERLWALGAGPERNPANLLWQAQLDEAAARAGLGGLLEGQAGNAFFSAAAPPHHAPGLRDRLRPRRRPAPDLRHTALRESAAADYDIAPAAPASGGDRRGAVALLRTLGGVADVLRARAVVSGVPHLDPTRNRRLVEVAARQPNRIRRRDGMNRAVARAAMADRLPDAIRLRTRRGEQLPQWLDVLGAARDEIAGEVAAAREHPLSRRLLDIDRLERLARSIPAPARRADPAVVRDYRLALWRGLSVSRYLRWYEGAV